MPCGISDAGVTSLSAETGQPVTVAETLPVMEGHLTEVLGHGTFTVTEDVETLASPAPMTTGVSAALTSGLTAAQSLNRSLDYSANATWNYRPDLRFTTSAGVRRRSIRASRPECRRSPKGRCLGFLLRLHVTQD